MTMMICFCLDEFRLTSLLSEVQTVCLFSLCPIPDPKFLITSVRRESEDVNLLTDTLTHFEKGQLMTVQGPAVSVHYCTCKPVWSTCGDSFPFTIR